MPNDWAKPKTALLGLPSLSKAAFLEGPRFSTSLSACCASKAVIRTVKRRGLANDFTKP